jgi:small subunit ribosomal protein S17
VHDPNASLREGDIISISPGWRMSKHVHHVVSAIIAPFGEPIEERPPVPTEEERIKEREEKKRIKDERRGRSYSVVGGAEQVLEGGAGGEGGRG